MSIIRGTHSPPSPLGRGGARGRPRCWGAALGLRHAGGGQGLPQGHTPGGVVGAREPLYSWGVGMDLIHGSLHFSPRTLYHTTSTLRTLAVTKLLR